MGSSPILPALVCALLLLCSALPKARGQGRLLPHRTLKEEAIEEGREQVLQTPRKKKTLTAANTTTIASKKNQTKLVKPISTDAASTATSISHLKLKSNKTATTFKNTTITLASLPKSKSNKTTSLSSNTTSVAAKLTTRPDKPKSAKPIKKLPDSPSHKTAALGSSKTQQEKKKNQRPKRSTPSLEESDDFISEFRDLPSKFHDALVPDLHKISTTSRAYLTLANKEFTRSFRPLVGTTYAPPLASLAFAVFLLLPLALVTVVFRRIRTHLPLQKLLLSVQIYLAVYFSVLALTAAFTGLEPLRFFHAASPGSYEYTQILQMLGYVLYLLLQLMNMVVVGPRALAAAQLVMAMAVGLHYYTAVFHRAVLGQAPRTNWRIHAAYAACFVLICAFARAERRKKEYLHGDGGGKKS